MKQGKKYYSIGEVADQVGLKEHVLRFWEKEFDFLRPITNNANHRKYTIREINLIKKIKYLVYDEKYTIPGARQKILELNKQGIGIFDEFNFEIFNHGLSAKPNSELPQPNPRVKIQGQSSIESGEKLSQAIQNISNTIDKSLTDETIQEEQIITQKTPVNNFNVKQKNVNNTTAENQIQNINQNTINAENVIPISKQELITTLQEILNLLN